MNRSVAAARCIAPGERLVLKDRHERGNDVAPAAKDRSGDGFRQPFAGAGELGKKGDGP